MKRVYARRMDLLKASDVRELLKITERPEIISFAGGLPAPELFPVEAILEANRRVLLEAGPRALQYATTEGYAPLRHWIAERMNARLGTDLTKDQILITHGSQQALDLSGKVFLDEGDVVICESPTYLAAIQAFRAYGCRFVAVPTDDAGMLPDALAQTLAAEPRARLIYMIPDFQNPTGRSWNLERRQALAQLARQFEVMVIEDNPYGELRFAGQSLPSVQALAPDCVLSLGTFSKIFCPGYRIGWIAGAAEVIGKYALVKQGTDLQCNTLAQMVIARYLDSCDIDAHITIIRDVYRRRRDAMLRAMELHFPPGVTFTRPDGGLFAWAELPAGLDARRLLARSLEQNVAFVPGDSFYPDGGHENTLRLNFSNMPEDRISEGIARLGGIIRAMMDVGA